MVIAALCVLGPGVCAAEPPPVQPVAVVRAAAVKGAKPEPVRLRGRITYRKDQLAVGFIQDSTGGMSFYPKGLTGPAPQAVGHNTVDMVGIPQLRDGMLMLCGTGSTADKPLPPDVAYLQGEAVLTPHKIELSALNDMRMEAEFVQTTAVMRRVVQRSKAAITVEVSSAGSRAVVRLPWLPEDKELEGWMNQQVVFKGVIVTRAEKRLLPPDVDAVIFVSNPSQWMVDPRVMADAFALPLVKVSDIWRSLPLSGIGRRVHLEGVVTAVRDPHYIDLRTADGSVEISSPQARQFQLGNRLSIVCGVYNKRGTTLLVDAVCKSLGDAPPVEPVALNSAADAAKMHYGELVSFQAVVRDVFRIQNRGRLLVALKEGGTCAILLEPFATAADITEGAIGSKYEFTGIFESGKDGGVGAEGANFVLHLRTDADVKLVSHGSWWTRQRLGNALWALLLVAGVAVPGTFILRRKTLKQEEKIRQFERANSAAQERKRIAAEFHDSLQQELASASLHLETLSEACLTSPLRMPKLLDDLSAMLRHCQIEARNLIWDLRSDDEFREGVTGPIRSWLAMRQRLVRETSLHFEAEGDEAKMPPDTCRHVMRITQEAVNNAVAHAGATRVSVRVTHEADRLEVLVEDDGRGFNTTTVPSAEKGHYGLSMLEERAQRIRARVDFRSEVNHGTMVRLVVPHSSF